MRTKSAVTGRKDAKRQQNQAERVAWQNNYNDVHSTAGPVLSFACTTTL